MCKKYLYKFLFDFSFWKKICSVAWHFVNKWKRFVKIFSDVMMIWTKVRSYKKVCEFKKFIQNSFLPNSKWEMLRLIIIWLSNRKYHVQSWSHGNKQRCQLDDSLTRFSKISDTHCNFISKKRLVTNLVTYSDHLTKGEKYYIIIHSHAAQLFWTHQQGRCLSSCSMHTGSRRCAGQQVWTFPSHSFSLWISGLGCSYIL